ncbi:MAG: carbohydrate ABC transporter permease [Firmicutes bacterium]|nr:carbohydrate ABC transporter permease [Bacillota bacterium]
MNVNGTMMKRVPTGLITRRKHRRIWGSIGKHLLLALVGAVFLFPFFWLVSTSLKSNQEIAIWPPLLLPKHPIWSNYRDAVLAFPFLSFLWNTLVIAFLNVAGAVFSSAVVAYGFAKVSWPGRNVVFFVVLATMMLPFQVTMVPLFVLFKSMGWIGGILPLVVPHFFGVAFYIFLLRQFYMTIPMELSEAARIDGANHIWIFSKVILPLAKPALAVVGLFQFVASWTDFLGPLIYLQNESQYTLQLGLQMFFGQHNAQWTLIMATATLITLPLVAIFLVAQRTFIEGIALTGIKG